MGGVCGSKEASPDQQQFICTLMSKEMMMACLDPALGRADKILIKLPPEFHHMKEASEKLRKLAEDAKGSAEAKRESASSAGLMGMFTQAADTVAGAVGQGAAVAFTSTADLLDQAMGGVEKPMSTIGKDLVIAQKDVIRTAAANHIVQTDVPDAVALCQGADDAISQHIVGKASDSLAKELLSKVDDFIKGHDTIKMWDAAIAKYNGAVDQAKKAGIADKLALKGISLNIKEYICKQTVLGLAEQMSVEEKAIRESPAGRSVACPSVFFKVFNKDKLTVSDYKKVTRK